MTKLQEYFDFMIDSGVSLYIGAHTHSYERSYPYYRNHSFVKAEPPYISTGQYLISIVEGVSGNNRSIVDAIPTVQDFTAKFTAN